MEWLCENPMLKVSKNYINIFGLICLFQKLSQTDHDGLMDKEVC